MADRAHIVVVDDEPEIRETLEEYLAMQGFAVTAAGNGAELRRALAAGPVDLVLLDLNMPGEDGLSLTRFLRQETRAGVILVTAAGEAIDRVVGLEMGADDYIPKPFDLRELLARVRSVLRRMPAAAGPAAAAPPRPEGGNHVVFGHCRLDLAGQRLFGADGAELAITAMEFDLLRTFARHPRQVLSRDRLLDLAHNRDWDPFDRSIDVRITRLRRKIEVDPAKPRIIKTVRGTGYMFVPDGEE
ncbi:DNA-binding response regulator [Allostella sp. ATCC 35155]|nr:DNA-binding response regulator [Stella sp. ATCC 35155]